jgi:hypothetical protein
MKKIPVNKAIWRKLCKIKNERGLNTLSQSIECLFDSQSDSKGENVQESQGPEHDVKSLQNLEEKTVLEEIYAHIKELKPSRKLGEEPVVEVPPTVDISSPISEDQDHIDDTNEKKEFISCPVCWNIVPLVVKLDNDGNPLKKHEDGIEYKMVDGVLQRRFSGPDDNYLPFQIQTGDKVIVEDSMAISTLKRLNKKLFDDFTNTLKNTTHKFTGGMW